MPRLPKTTLSMGEELHHYYVSGSSPKWQLLKKNSSYSRDLSRGPFITLFIHLGYGSIIQTHSTIMWLGTIPRYSHFTRGSSPNPLILCWWHNHSWANKGEWSVGHLELYQMLLWNVWPVSEPLEDKHFLQQQYRPRYSENHFLYSSHHGSSP